MNFLTANMCVQEAFNLFVSPQAVLPYNDPVVCKVKVNNPVFDYVPPELITLYISNVYVTPATLKTTWKLKVYSK